MIRQVSHLCRGPLVGRPAGFRIRVVWVGLDTQATGNLPIQFGDLCVEKVQLAQLAAQQKAMMLPERARPRLRQLLALAAHPPARQLGKPLRIILAIKQGV